ncbi:MAG: hypothetical protein JWP35_1004 [Caulobacter sp.]|nr:hypothetical protein [Caulobacter sp.]
MAKTLKKSESLEIRIPYPTKQAFMARCQDEGRSASEALRLFIEQHLDGQPAAKVPARWSRKSVRLAAGALVALAVGAVALPSLARSNPQVGFERLDLNGDRRITAAEFSQGVAVDAGFTSPSAQSERITLSAATDAESRDLLLALAFRRMDADRDGAINFDEYRAHLSAPATH